MTNTVICTILAAVAGTMSFVLLGLAEAATANLDLFFAHTAP